MGVDALVDRLREIVGDDGLITDPVARLTYESDALTHLRIAPGAVVLPESVKQVQDVVRLCHATNVPFVARGHGTGLSGGALPTSEGVLIALTRLNRILEVDAENFQMTVEPGVTNLEISRCVEKLGLYYAPDPSSQQVCSIGGNVAENSGGAHCLKYGFTVHHVMALEVVLPDGGLIRIGGKSVDTPGLDLLGIIVGSEGTLGIVTKVTVRLLRRQESKKMLIAAFDSTDLAGAAVSGIIAAGIIPAAVEMMDRMTIEAAESAVHPNFPNAEALLLVEIDGPLLEVEIVFNQVQEIVLRNSAREMRVATSEVEREQYWRGRKAAFAAMGRVSPNYYVQDGVIPRTKLPEVLRRIRALEVRSGLRIGNVFHAGDGNLHPLICYDEAVEGNAKLAAEVGAEILTYCIEAGGSLTGEHGVGADKACQMPKMFNATDLDTMQRLRRAFDSKGICNPDKIFPTPRLCGEVPGPYRPHPIEKDGLAERF